MANITINQLPPASSIDPVNDLLPIYNASSTSTEAINRNTYLNLASQPVGLTDNQTLTNKILTSPALSSPVLSGTISGTYTIGGTPTFPSSVVTLTGTQTLTNKTLTSPTVNSPIITNATLSTDSITGFTTSNAGTIYGISVSGAQITTANSVTTAALSNASVTPNKLSTGAAAGFTTGSSTTTNTAYALLADAASTTSVVTVGSNGLALVAINSLIGNSNGSDTSFLSFSMSGANTQAAADSMAISYQAWTSNTSDIRGGTFLLTGLTAGSTTFSLQYRVVAGTGTFQYRRIAVIPL